MRYSYLSARVSSSELVFSYPPTAVQALLDVHDTPNRKSNFSSGSGVDWTDHVVPFQLSANPRPLSSPTAVQAFALVQDTPSSLLFVVGLGVS